MKNSIKKLLMSVAAVIFAVVVIIMLIRDGEELKGIKDTNGADNYSLQTITDENIIKQDIGMKGGLHVRNATLTNDVIISCDNLTGVYEVLFTSTIGRSDFRIYFSEFVVRGGNFKAALICNDKIVKELDFTDSTRVFDFVVKDLKGDIRFVIAGEEADFKIRIPRNEYDRFSHP